jgi:hypothetical protein
MSWRCQESPDYTIGGLMRYRLPAEYVRGKITKKAVSRIHINESIKADDKY